MNTITILEFSSLPPPRLMNGGGNYDVAGHERNGAIPFAFGSWKLCRFLTECLGSVSALHSSYIRICSDAQIRVDQAVLEEIGGQMVQVKVGARIENPRNYESGAVEQLRRLLHAASPAKRDPHRENFYEIESDSETYYILISPINGNIVLLAKWLRQSQNCCLSAGNFVA